MTALFLIALAVFALLGAIAIRTPASTRIRVLALALVIVAVPFCYVALGELRGRPKPITQEWARAENTAVVLAVNFNEGEAIYLWLGVDGVPEPRYYALPWRTQLAANLQNAQTQALADGGAISIDLPGREYTVDALDDLGVRVIVPGELPRKPAPAVFRTFSQEKSRI